MRSNSSWSLSVLRGMCARMWKGRSRKGRGRDVDQLIGTTRPPCSIHTVLVCPSWLLKAPGLFRVLQMLFPLPNTVIFPFSVFNFLNVFSFYCTGSWLLQEAFSIYSRNRKLTILSFQ